MRQSFRRTARFAAVATLPLVFMAAQPVVDGMSYEFVMKSTSKATGNKETITMRGRGTYAGDDAKIELLEAHSATGGTDAWGGKGTYFIVKNGKDMLLVNPAEKTYMKWDMMAMMAGLGKAMNAVGGLVKMELSDIKIETHDMGAGPSVQGYATRHFRMIQNYSVSAKVFGRTSKTRSESTTDYYIAPTLKIANPFVMNAQQTEMMGQFDMFNTPDYKNQMAAANAKMPKTGVPLRMETKMVSTDEKGKAETSTSVMEMMNFKAGNIPASTFEIPSDYKMVEMAPMTAGADGHNAGHPDSASAKKVDPAKEAAAKLKGLFGGKKK